MKYFKYIIPVFVLIFLAFPFSASAIIGTTDPCNALSHVPETQKLCLFLQDIEDLLWALGLALAVIIIIIGGIQYMTAASDETKVKKAKQTITYGLIGAAIILLASFIFELVVEFLSERFGS